VATSEGHREGARVSGEQAATPRRRTIREEAVGAGSEATARRQAVRTCASRNLRYPLRRRLAPTRLARAEEAEDAPPHDTLYIGSCATPRGAARTGIVGCV
jgi:hypothetical protein